MLAQRVDGRLGDERHEGEARGLGGVLVLFRVAYLLHVREVHMEDRMHVRRRSPAEHHVLCDLPAHER